MDRKFEKGDRIFVNLVQQYGVIQTTFDDAGRLYYLVKYDDQTGKEKGGYFLAKEMVHVDEVIDG